MAARMKFLGASIVLLAAVISFSDAQCQVPKQYWGDFYSMEQGVELNTLVNEEELTNEIFQGRCYDLKIDNATYDAAGNHDSKILFYSPASGCFVCWDIYFRTPNVLQFKKSSCVTRDANTGRVPSLDYVCSDILPQTALYTLFRKELAVVNCRTTFEGVYRFTYEIDYGGGGICDNSNSVIIACQEPGSQYVDNQIFQMNFARCSDVGASVNNDIRFQCMGTWRDPSGNIWSAMTDTGADVQRERYRCMLTREDQQRDDNWRRYTLSRWAECSTLKSPYDGDIRLMLLPALSAGTKYEHGGRTVVYGSQLVEPGCNLPRNFTGTWFTTGEFDTDVVMNATHIYFKTKLDQFTFRESYFTCQQNYGSRYLMTAVTVGKCEVDYVCMDFLPRHHNIIRWRMGKPYRLTQDETSQPDFLYRKFRQACSWYSFTIDRTQTDWTYNVFLLNPPAPVDCPIAGRYRFTQKGSEPEKYRTRVEGITQRPRHQIDCRQYESEFKSCADNTKKILVDIEYCATLDHTGRPIGEYDIPDRELSCVGFWMEDMRSYMITYDEEDAVSAYRCWVYERLDWRDLIISRSTRAICGRNQTARSYLARDGASLFLELKESERLFDDCPQRFNDGSDPYRTELQIYVFGGAAAVRVSFLALIVTMLSLFIRTL